MYINKTRKHTILQTIHMYKNLDNHIIFVLVINAHTLQSIKKILFCAKILATNLELSSGTNWHSISPKYTKLPFSYIGQSKS